MRGSDGEDFDCLICGGNSSAFWDGVNGQIRVCGFCAIEWLPALIADAVPVSASEDFPHRTLARIELRFWRALALRLDRERRESKA